MKKTLVLHKKILLAIVIGLFTMAMATGAMAEQKEQIDVYEQNKLTKSVVFVVDHNHRWKDPRDQDGCSPIYCTESNFCTSSLFSQRLGCSE
ncbi:hypothetical protein [Desulforamulus reducens]|uniref:hypothetical protein n=1 Tax=Desulforamulus reducens TaxID=59610 RepID=UPI0002D9A898|nr:hypothetical protein [Desulforamulus reducens]